MTEMFGETYYIKKGRRYIPIGREFTWFPAEGVWLVYSNGGSKAATRLIALEDLPEDITKIGDAASFRLKIEKEIPPIGNYSIQDVIDIFVKLITNQENK